MKRLATIVLAMATAFSGVSPAFAENSRDEQSVQSRGTFGDSGVDNHRSNGCNVYRCGGRYRHGYNNRYYNNRYYGDRYYGRHYNHDYNNTGAIIGGLAAGALLGGLIASQPYARSSGNPHVDWCYSRYRSYRAYDNTYQPYYGPRRQCVSP